ncbi:hypothetical protein FN976_06825 [Caenimonas sedimenti]|uniref:Uncharacterized protein n=2 Tax=Caenimonas sedimenti TaxID=2596921 RepID=A0A562ZUY2_9BURK|nr:hypothetical protein FN976_06825 [Caenimonas sedimenti]
MCEPAKKLPEVTPFEEVQRLTGPYEHENVAFARCKVCAKAALYYSADIYDDFWQYWCLIDEAEKAVLAAPDDDEEPQRPARAREILGRKSTLIKGPVLGFEWCVDGAQVLEGPPW